MYALQHFMPSPSDIVGEETVFRLSRCPFRPVRYFTSISHERREQFGYRPMTYRQYLLALLMTWLGLGGRKCQR